MKKTIVFIALACLFIKASAQTDAQNHKKYWDLRDRYKKYFTCIGKDQGMSIPISTRSESFWASPNSAPTLYYGDASSALGWYISVLATEYHLLKEYGHNAEAQTTLNELYYAIKAVNRLDDDAEIYLSQGAITIAQRNGFYLRDDVQADYWQNWNNSDNKYLNDNIQYKTVLSDFFHNSTTNSDPTKFNPENEPSQDQHIALMMGFLFVKEFVGSVTVQPTPQDAPLNLLSEVQAMTNRIMERLDEYVELGEEKEFQVVIPGNIPCQHTKKFKSNYTIKNPVDGSIAAGKNSYFIFAQAYGINELAKEITGVPFNRDYKFGWDVTGCSLAQPRTFDLDYDQPNTFNFDEYWYKTAGFFTTVPIAPIPAVISYGVLNTATSLSLKQVWGIIENACTPDGKYDFGAFVSDPDDPDVNFQMHLNLASTTNTWARQKVHSVARGMKQQVFLLMFDLFKKVKERHIIASGGTVPVEIAGSIFDYKNEIKDILDPIDCKGSYIMSATDRAAGGWDVGHRWLHSTKTATEKAKSENLKSHFHSLDYMILYNLYHIAYGLEGERVYNNSNHSTTITKYPLPDYNPNVTCPCTDVTLNLNQPLETFKEIVPRFNHYKDFGVVLSEYVNADWRIQTSQGYLKNKNTILTVCNNSSLSIHNEGKLQVGENSTNANGTIIIKRGSTLSVENDGVLAVENEGRVVIEEGATLKIYPNSTIVLNGENAILEIRGNLVLMPDAIFKTTGDGFVRFNIPTVNNSPNITVTGNNCQMLFESTNIGDKRIEVSSNTNLYPPSNLKLFKLENSTAHLGVKAGIFLPCDFHIIGNTITRIPNLVDNSISGGGTRIHNGITIYAISHTQTISDNTFSDGKKALTLLNPQGFYDIKVHYNDFTNCDMGIQIRNGRSHIFANSFLDCGQAVQALDFARSIRFESNFIGGSNNTETGFGFEITSPNYGEVAIAGNAFNKTITGFHADKAVATLQCNYFYHNQQAIDALHSGNLNISSIVPSSGISLANGNPLLGGYNYFNIPTNKKGIRVTAPWYLVSPNFLNSYINEGFNSFSNDNAGNYNHPSWETNRPTNTLSTISPDIIINNNYWGQQATTYTPPSSPYNYIDVNHGASIHFKIDENYTPRYILGTNSTSTTTCPVTDWTDALTNPQSFNPNTKRPPSGNGPVINAVRKGSTLGGFNGVYGGTNTTQDVPSGAYSGINVKTAFQTVFNGFSQEVPIAGGGTETQINPQGLLNLSALLNATLQLTSPEVKSMNVFGYQKYLSGMGDAIGAGAFIDNPTEVSSQLAAANALFDKILYINDQTNLSDTPHYQMKFQTELDRMIVNWMFGKYSDALTINNYISTFVRSEEQNRLSYWNCVIENERKVINNEITPLEYAQNTSTCALLYPYSPELWYGINSSQGGSGGSSTPSISYTLTPNPATTTITVSINLTIDANVNIAVFNKFGVKVVNDINMGALLAGNHTQDVLISGLPADVYNMAVYVNGVPYVQHFIKQTE